MVVPARRIVIYVGRRGSARVLARLFTETACYQCFPMVGLKLLVTSFECFGGCRFTAAANTVHSARKISSAETAANSRPADADDLKPGGQSHDRASLDGLADHMRFRHRLACRRRHRLLLALMFFKLPVLGVAAHLSSFPFRDVRESH
jgi:hypothetical protein